MASPTGAGVCAGGGSAGGAAAPGGAAPGAGTARPASSAASRASSAASRSPYCCLTASNSCRSRSTSAFTACAAASRPSVEPACEAADCPASAWSGTHNDTAATATAILNATRIEALL